ncbi:catalase-related domain-containing protein [Nonomuraea salmonea]|uniref:Catalase-related domain-containing protein n=1 Tax=Nonomuraea salmonea TaxID=46181 RepID=A0ABV5NHP9_9ACTN
MRSAYHKHAEDDDHSQPRALWENVLSDTDRAHLISNIVGHAGARSGHQVTRSPGHR